MASRAVESDKLSSWHLAKFLFFLIHSFIKTNRQLNNSLKNKQVIHKSMIYLG